MSLLRSLRNLAVLVIVTVGGLSLIPRPMAALSVCRWKGALCQSSRQCCLFLLCSPITHRCCGYYHQACTSPTQCCSGICSNGGCI
jgi:hypothetical protein